MDLKQNYITCTYDKNKPLIVLFRIFLLSMICIYSEAVVSQNKINQEISNNALNDTIQVIYLDGCEQLKAGRNREKVYAQACYARELATTVGVSELNKWRAEFLYAHARQEHLDEHAEPYIALRMLINKISSNSPAAEELKRNIYHSLTSSCLLLNKLDSAVNFAHKAEAIGSNLFDETSCDRVVDYFLLAYSYIESAQDEAALSTALRALDLATAHCSETSVEFIDAHRLMGYYYVKSNYQATKALPFYQRALRISLNIEDADRAFKSLYYICRTGLFSNGLDIVESHIAYFDSIQLISDHITGIKCHLARLDIEYTMARQQDSLSLAIRKKVEFQELLKSELPERRSAILDSYFKLIEMAIATDDAKKVLKYLNQLDKFYSHNDLNQDQLLSYYQVKSSGLSHVSRWKDAFQSAKSGISILAPKHDSREDKVPDVDIVNDLYFYRQYLIICADYFKNQYDKSNQLIYLQQNQRMLNQVVACLVRMIERDDERMSKQSTNQIANDFERLISVNILLFQQTKQSTYLNEALQLTDIASNLTFFRGANQRQSITRTEIADSLIAMKKNLTSELINLRLSRQDQTAINRLQSKKEELDLSIDISRINLFLEEHEPIYTANIRAVSSTPLETFQKELLDSSTAFIQYFFYNELYAYVVLHDTLISVSLPISDVFKHSIGMYEQLLSEPGSPLDSFIEMSRTMGVILLDSAITQLPESINKLIIAPYGRLAKIPFESLLIERPSGKSTFGNLPYLIKKYTVSYAFSMTGLHRKMKNNNASGVHSFLGVSPVYEQVVIQDKTNERNERLNFSALPGAVKEVKEIGHLIKRREILTGQAANKKAIVGHMSQHSIWHFAMHAIFNEKNPMLSSLYFSNGEDLKARSLTAAEIYNMELEADLVVLSACNTGVGKHDYVQGTMSLARAFSYAGARATILSAWPAADQSTSEFFPIFYNHLIAGQSKALALQETKIEWLSQRDLRHFHHPYYWSTFTLWGNTKPLDYLTRADNLYWWVIAGCGLLIYLMLKLLVRTIPTTDTYTSARGIG